MGIRPTNDPYGGVNPLIDKMIGNAYDIVKYVARYLKEIRYVAENMEQVYQAAEYLQAGGASQGGLPSNQHYLITMGYGYSPIQLILPENVALEDIYGVQVVAMYGGTLLTPGPNTFSFKIEPGIIYITTNSSYLNTATYRAVVTTGQ